jgi:hypothetical protein
MRIQYVVVDEIPKRCIACPIRPEAKRDIKCGSSCKAGDEIFKVPDKRCICKVEDKQ